MLNFNSRPKQSLLRPFLAMISASSLALIGVIAVPAATETASAETVFSIDGEAEFDQSGYSVALSGDGSRVAIGATGNDGNGDNAGTVILFRLFELKSALTPTFGTPTNTRDGFTTQVSNFDAGFSWNVSVSAGSAVISGTGLITVTGLSAGDSSTVTVSTTRSGYSAGSAKAESAVDKKLTVGSFKGFIAIYTKGYEGSKLSAKVAGKWLVVDSLEESWRGNDYSRTVRFTGAGYDIFVHLYIDGEYIRTDELTTK